MEGNLKLSSVPSQAVTLLRGLMEEDVVERFALAGGTSLALRYGHRLSVDLDFFTREEFDPEALRDGLKLEAFELSRSPGSLSMVSNQTKVEFLRHDYPMLETIENIDGFRLYSVRDVAAMKLNALVNRGSKKDFYDLAELLSHFSLEELLEWFANKYRQSEPFMVLRSLTWFEDAEKEPDPVSNKGMDWIEVKATVSEAARRY